jgi:hypothetical protein
MHESFRVQVDDTMDIDACLNAAGPMDNYYAEALRDYAAVTYEAFNSYLMEGLRYWYDLYPPSEEGSLRGPERWPMLTKQMHLLRHARAMVCA